MEQRAEGSRMTRPPRLKAKPMAGRRGEGEIRRRGDKAGIMECWNDGRMG